MNTTYFMDLVAGNLFKTKTSPAIPATYYIGLSTTAPNPNGSGVKEPTGYGYKRVQLRTLSTPSSGVVQNSASISFDESTGPWGRITHFVIYDAQSNGNLLMYGELSTPRTVETDTVVTIKEHALKLSIANS